MAIFSITGFVKEARRRRVFRVIALYIVGAWVVLQVADLAFPALDIPEAAIRYVWLGVILAFPMALVLGWRYDIVDGRVKRTVKTDKDADLALGRTDFVILSAFVAVVATIIVGLGTEIADTQDTQESAERTGTSDQASVVVANDTQESAERTGTSDQELTVGTQNTQERAESAFDLGPGSIAVLPFVNMSLDPENAFFADGLAEELLNALASIRGLQVIARTSSFSFRNQNVDIREIGHRLGVANVIEGSVRLAGETIRISVQLIDSRNGVHRWSTIYERPMQDVFALQDDIVRDVVFALRDSLEPTTFNAATHSELVNRAFRNVKRGSAGGSGGGTFFAPGRLEPTLSAKKFDAYAQFLRGRSIIQNLGRTEGADNIAEIEKAVGFFDSAISDYPSLIDAYAMLAEAYRHLLREYEQSSELDKTKAKEAESAFQDVLNSMPRLGRQLSSDVNRMLGVISEKMEKERLYRAAISINPNNADAYFELGDILISNGLRYEGADFIRKSQQLDPLDPHKAIAMSAVLRMEGSLREASTYFQLGNSLTTQTPVDAAIETGRPEHLSRSQTAPSNLDFESNSDAWEMKQECNYEFLLSEESYSGQWSGHLKSLSDTTKWCPVLQGVSAKQYLGRYVQFAGMVKARGITESAKIWVNVTDATDIINFSDLYPDFITEDSDWTEVEVRIYVPTNARSINFGAVLIGQGELWIDDFRLDVSDSPDF